MDSQGRHEAAFFIGGRMNIDISHRYEDLLQENAIELGLTIEAYVKWLIGEGLRRDSWADYTSVRCEITKALTA